MMKPESLEVLKAILDLFAALIMLGLGWFVGNRLTLKWNLIPFHLLAFSARKLPG